MLVNRSQLLAAVALVLPGVAKKEVFEQANKLGIQNGNLISYNDEISILHEFPELHEVEGALDGVRLYEILQRMTSENVTVELAGSALSIRSGSAKVVLKMSELALPLSELGEETSEQFVVDEPFRKDVQLISEICAKDMSRPVLTCVHVKNGWIEGSDSYRTARIKCSKSLPEILIPASSAFRIMNYDVVKLILGNNNEWIHCKTDTNTTISGRVVASSYPNLDFIYKIKGSSFSLPTELSEILERAKVFASRVHKIDEEVVVGLRSGRIIIKAHDESGNFSETVRWDHKDIEAEFSINPDFFKKALQQGTKCSIDKTKIKFMGDNWEHVIALR